MLDAHIRQLDTGANSPRVPKCAGCGHVFGSSMTFTAHACGARNAAPPASPAAGSTLPTRVEPAAGPLSDLERESANWPHVPIQPSTRLHGVDRRHALEFLKWLVGQEWFDVWCDDEDEAWVTFYGHVYEVSAGVFDLLERIRET